MNARPSFQRFDYLLRTNKQVERKVVFDLLHAASQKVGFASHWYLGFGSMWFGDFRLAHRLLKIDQLVSMEREVHAARAAFNRPFAAVKIMPGESSVTLQQLDDEYWTRPVIAWLDYDGHLDGDSVRDIGAVIDKAQLDSVLIVTVNASRHTYRARTANGPTKRSDTSVGVVEQFLGPGTVPAKFEPVQNAVGAFSDVSEALFPEFLSEAVEGFMAHRAVVSAREIAGERVTFLPLFRLHHRDGADMVTVGGVLVGAATRQHWMGCRDSCPMLVKDSGGTDFCSFDLIPLTVKEKIALDECLPAYGDGQQFLVAARAAGVKISDSEIAKYGRFYRHFPVYVETTI
jgi:hypothetical protein